MAVTVVKPAAVKAAEARSEGELSIVWRRFRRHRAALVGLGILFLLLVISALAPAIAPYGRDEIDRSVPAQYRARGFAPPSQAHLLGTDELNRDMLSRLMYAGQVSLAVGFAGMLFATTVGMVIGALAGFYKGLPDSILMRITDLFLSFPAIPLLMVIASIIKNYKLEGDQTIVQVLTIVLVLAFLGWMQPARLIRGEFLSLMGRDFVLAARALGASNRRIIWRHLIPNSVAPLVVFGTLAVADFILVESALSFLGLGISPPTPSWGNMLSAFQGAMRYPEARWMVFLPGSLIFLAVISINFVGDGLRDALDPWLRNR